MVHNLKIKRKIIKVEQKTGEKSVYDDLSVR